MKTSDVLVGPLTPGEAARTQAEMLTRLLDAALAVAAHDRDFARRLKAGLAMQRRGKPRRKLPNSARPMTKMTYQMLPKSWSRERRLEKTATILGLSKRLVIARLKTPKKTKAEINSAPVDHAAAYSWWLTQSGQ